MRTTSSKVGRLDFSSNEYIVGRSKKPSWNRFFWRKNLSIWLLKVNINLMAHNQLKSCSHKMMGVGGLCQVTSIIPITITSLVEISLDMLLVFVYRQGEVGGMPVNTMLFEPSHNFVWMGCSKTQSTLEASLLINSWLKLQKKHPFFVTS